MNTSKEEFSKPTGPVFVVTRDGRRTSERNYKTEWDAKIELDYWFRLTKQWDSKSRISIAKTDKPRRIR
jgi:hypothetical protein